MSIFLIFLFAAPFIGGVLALTLSGFKPANLKLFLSFSGAFLFGITILKIIPEVFINTTVDANLGIYILAGFFFQIILEQFTKGKEHGHLHIHAGHKAYHSFPWVLFLSLSLHSFIEGMPLSEASFLDENSKQSLLFGIALHEAPAAFALMSVLKTEIKNKTIIWLTLISYSLMPIAGIFCSNMFIGTSIVEENLIFQKLMAVVVGTFLHISTTILFENSENHRYSLLRIISIMVGTSLACITLL